MRLLFFEQVTGQLVNLSTCFRLVIVQHPVYAILVGTHPECRTPECVLQRHGHRTAGGQSIEGPFQFPIRLTVYYYGEIIAEFHIGFLTRI